jgi:adenylate cyclase
VHVFALQPDALAGLPAPSENSAPVRSRPRGYLWATAAIALVLVVGVAVTDWWFRPSSNSPSSASIATNNAKSIATISHATSAPRFSIVVLPFVNLSSDPDQEYFADGITDDLTTDLSRVSDSFVIARNTAFTFKGKPVDIKQVGRELNVRYALESSVRRDGDQIRVNTQLINAETGAHVWADRFDKDRADIFKLQNKVTARIARALNLALIRLGASRDRRRHSAKWSAARGRLLSPGADVHPVRRSFMPSFNQHNMSRRGFCLCCMGATTLAATGGWLTPRKLSPRLATSWI